VFSGFLTSHPRHPTHPSKQETTNTQQQNLVCGPPCFKDLGSHRSFDNVVPVVTTQPEAGSAVGIGAVVWLMARLFVLIVGVPLLLLLCVP
jgi:hypothetical protein